MAQRKEIEALLLSTIYSAIGMDKPENHDEIVDFIKSDVEETADPENWHSGDVAIAFRRFIESKPNTPEEENNPNFDIKVTGGGTQKELATALRKLADTIEGSTTEELDGAEFEDPTLFTELSEE